MKMIEKEIENQNKGTASPQENLPALPKALFKKPWLSLLSVLAAGVFLMLTWWKIDVFGIRWPISVVIISLLYILNAFLQEKKIPTSSWILIAIAILTASIHFFRVEVMSDMFAFMVSALCLLLLSADFLNGQWWQYRIREYLKQALRAVAAFFVGLPTMLSQLNSDRNSKDGNGTQGKKIALSIIKGVLIAVPLLLIFTFLFSVADEIFENRLDAVVQWMRTQFLQDLLGRVLLTLFFSWLAAAGLWFLVSNKQKPLKIEPDEAFFKPFLGMTETSIVLVSLNLLFAFFLLIQFQYFFAGKANISLEGFTYAEYARRGFVELLWAASIAGLVFYALAAVTKRESKARQTAFSILSSLLLVQVGVILVASYQRILLYEDAYGLTHVRLIPQIFTFFLAAILLALVVMEWRKQFKRLALVLLVAFILFTITVAGINVDQRIARVNIERAIEGKNLDYEYLVYQLSDDAVPYMFEKIESGDLPDGIRANLTKVLVCRDSQEPSRQRPWLENNFPGQKAAEYYASRQDLLSQYPLEVKEFKGAQGFQIGETFLYCGYSD